MIRAVLSPTVRRRWDLIAVEQLCERVAALEEENGRLRLEVARAEEVAEHWFQNCQELTADPPGLTLDGRLVRAQP